MSLLEVKDLTVYYGPVRGVETLSLEVEEGTRIALLGANGAGKTTILKAVSGLVRPRSGEIRFGGRNLEGVATADRVRLGLVQVPEGRRIFPALSVRENLELAGFGIRPAERRKRVRETLEHFDLLVPHLGKLAGTLSGGEQQVLAIARGVVARPRLLMVDEPSLGLAPRMVESVYDLLVRVSEGGTAVLLVEQNVALALEITSWAYVLKQGSLAISGPSERLVGDPRVVAAYLGEDEDQSNVAEGRQIGHT